MVAVSWLFKRSTPARVDKWFRRLQLISASLYSPAHGGNDAQKTTGIIWMLLIAAGMLGTAEPVPMWVVVSCYFTIALGTAFGGWRIVRTMGQRITRLKPVGGFCAETGGAMSLFLATGLGIPVSTTHTIAGSIAGVGAAHSVSALRWGIAGSLVIAWILTIPCSAFIAAVAWWLAQHAL
jgi:PiT family inorganic phosphate transporter